MQNVFIIHGIYGDGNENWFPWLRAKLESRGIKVFTPRFPTPENQSLDNWLKVFDEFNQYVTSETIFVAHSLAVPFTIALLERFKAPIRAAFFVSGFLHPLGNDFFDDLNKTFINRDIDWQTVKSNCARFFIYHSDNDPYVPISEAQEISRHLDTDLKVIKNAGHFNEDSGYTKFEELLQDLSPLLN